MLLLVLRVQFLMYKIVVIKSEGKKPLGRPRRKWEENIRMDPREIG